METIFLELVKLSLIGSLFAAAVMLVRLIFPKTPKWLLCLMWGVVALRLICPVSIESRLSLVPDRIASGQIIASVGDAYIGDVDITHENEAGYQDAVEAGRQPVYSDDGYYVVTETDSLEAPKTVAGTLYPILSWVWAAGMVAMLSYTVISYLTLRGKMAEATLLRENIWQCEQVDSPFVLGFIRPRIYLPYTITESDMVNVIAHEQAHIHRKDHWWKPVGFILLSLHWFNPVLWVAYILLCRDIEAACDEKVIKDMERDEIRAYSTALLNCSVNRRRIAACPLAFGEVGVKERVKTVMNYKKPAFWIVIAAVALCIVVAVSFLTDPKGYGPEVGNPKMLEFPGVEWFVTPEELKEALNITEEQIVNEEIVLDREDVGNDYDRYELYVTDLTLYGREVTYALFQFRRDPGYDFAFQDAIVMFAEDTDMEKLKNDLVEIYGTGSSEPYSYYLYYNNRKKNFDLKLRMEQNLEYRSIHDFFSKELDGNPYQEALDDPAYMTHHWATENGCSVIPEEVVAWFQHSLDQSANTDSSVLQDDEALLEMLDQLPWVAMTLSNRCVPTIQRDATGTEDESSSYYTNNYLEFSAAWLADYLHAAREDKQEDTTTATDPTEEVVSVQPPEFADLATLCFPGLNWGMTPAEVKNALNIADEQILLDEQYEYPPDTKHYDERWNLYVKDLTIFDSKVALAFFEFISITGDETPAYEYIGNTGGEFALARVQVFLDEETDMAKLEQSLTAEYGQGIGSEYSYIDSLATGRPINATTSANEFLRYFAKVSGEDNVYKAAMDDPGYMEQLWVCTDANVVSGGIREYFTGVISGNGYKEEEIQEWLNQFPWITLRFTNTTHWGISKEAGELEDPLAEYIGQNYMEYMTSAYVAIAQRAALNAAE